MTDSTSTKPEFPKAPLFTYKGSPSVYANGDQIIRPYDEPLYDNYKVFAAAGSVPLETEASPEQIVTTMAGRKTSGLLGNQSSARLHFFKPVEAMVVSADGDALIVQRSQRGASKGECQHTAGGFPKVGWLDQPETPEQTVRRKASEELGLDFGGDPIVDLECRSFDNPVSSFVLSGPDGKLRPGATAEILESFAIISSKTTKELLAEMKPNCESVGVAIMTSAALTALARGQGNVEIAYVPNSALFAQPVIETAKARGEPLELSVVRDLLREAPPLTKDERAQRGAFDQADAVLAVASPDVFSRRAIAVGLAALEASRLPQAWIAPDARQYVADYRRDAQDEVILPNFMRGIVRPVSSTGIAPK